MPTKKKAAELLVRLTFEDIKTGEKTVDRMTLDEYMKARDAGVRTEAIYFADRARGSKGGRPEGIIEFRKWAADFDARKAANRTKKSMRELYDDVTDSVNETRAKLGKKPVKWTQIRDGIAKARKG